MLSFFPRDVSDEILDLIESVSEGFPTYSWMRSGTELSQVLRVFIPTLTLANGMLLKTQ